MTPSWKNIVLSVFSEFPEEKGHRRLSLANEEDYLIHSFSILRVSKRKKSQEAKSGEYGEFIHANDRQDQKVK